MISRLFFSGLFLIGLTVIFSQTTFAKTDSEVLFSPAYQQLPMNAAFMVDVIIKSAEPLVGADVKINFDPRVLEVDSIKNGGAFEKVPLKAVKSNTITLTGLHAQGDKVHGGG